MKKQSKGRSRPLPDAGEIKSITIKLQEALCNENNFDCNYYERKPWEVTMSARDSAVNMMRFLRVWFDLPGEVFFTGVTYLDMLLAKMKVQEKFLSCASVSCFDLAAAKHGFEVDSHQLVFLSQSKCSIEDMKRMSKIITQKLTLKDGKYSTSFDLLEVYMNIFRYIAVQFRIEGLLNRMLQMQRLCTRLEVLCCDSSCASIKSSTLTLAFLHHEMERFLSREVPKKSNYYSMEMFYILAVMIELQNLCKIDSNVYLTCFEKIKKVLKVYDSRKKTKNSQNLSWRFSASTHALSKSDYYPMLNSIKEE